MVCQLFASHELFTDISGSVSAPIRLKTALLKTFIDSWNMGIAEGNGEAVSIPGDDSSIESQLKNGPISLKER